MGASAAPSTIMAAFRKPAPGNPTKSTAAANAVTSAMRSTLAGATRNNSNDENPRDARNPHQ